MADKIGHPCFCKSYADDDGEPVLIADHEIGQRDCIAGPRPADDWSEDSDKWSLVRELTRIGVTWSGRFLWAFFVAGLVAYIVTQAIAQANACITLR